MHCLLTYKLTMHADPLMQPAAMGHLAHVALNIDVRPGPVLDDDVVLDNQPCYSFPLSVTEQSKRHCHLLCYKNQEH